MSRLGLERTLTGWLILILIAVVGSTWISHRELLNIIRNDQDVIHSYDVLDQLSDTLSLLKDAESGQRGYLITGNESYLEPYQQAVTSITDHLQGLQKLTVNDPAQSRLLALLAGHISTKLQELRETIELRRKVSFEAAQALVQTDEGKKTMDEITGVGDLIENQETDLLRAQLAASAASSSEARITVLGVGALAMLLIAVFYFQMTRSVAQRSILLGQEKQARAAAEASFHAERQARDRAEQASRLKDEFLATVSHELRTPLNAILGWARMLQAGTIEPGAEVRGLLSIERNAVAQAQLIEDLLDISRIVAGRLRLEVVPLDLVPVIQAAIDVVKPAAEAKQIKIGTMLGQGAAMVTGDAQRLQQVIWNLLSNSIKFTPAGGRVDLRLERTDAQFKISVTDTGQGIDPKFLPHVFELFRQADAGPSRKQGGLGLGLAIVLRIVEMHGGTIGVASAGESCGSTFTVELPPLGGRAAAETGGVPVRSVTAAPKGLADAPRLDGLRLLAVDDERDTLEVIEAVLTQSGATVRTCQTTRDALEILQSWRPDLVIADIGLPEQDGYALIQQVRNLPPERGGQTPAIALTAYTRVEDRMTTLSAGYQMHVSKPVEPVELVMILASLVGGPPNTTQA